MGRDPEPRHIEALALRLIGVLRTHEIPAPAHQEKEIAYTARALVPLVKSCLSDLAGEGIVVFGDGTGQQAYAYHMLGRWFYPDVAVVWKKELVLAVEVKLLAQSKSNSVLSGAIGQAALYSCAGFKRSALFLVDTSSSTSPAEIVKAETDLRDRFGFELVCRRSSRGKLIPHPSDQAQS